MNRRCVLLTLGLAFLLTAPSEAAARGPFTVGSLMAGPGKSVSGFLVVPGGVDKGTEIPVTLIHGADDGPVLALMAGTHGYEYAPIIALQKIRTQIDPRQLSGTLILVHIANLPSFLGRTIYYSPVDGKNLNRVYPGKADGTVSERIAHVITTEVIARAHAVVDLHCGDGNEALRPYSYWTKTGKEELDKSSRAMAVAFGLDPIVIVTDRPADPQASVYTDNTALTRGKPAITTETGQLGETRPGWVALVERGVWNLLRHFQMVPGEPQRAEGVVWLDKYEVVRSPQTGIFYAAVEPGQLVASGTVLGQLTDFFGAVLAEVRAPFDGLVTYVVATPPVSQGEPLAMVAQVHGED